jgi:hypothetical protein
MISNTGNSNISSFLPLMFLDLAMIKKTQAHAIFEIHLAYSNENVPPNNKMCKQQNYFSNWVLSHSQIEFWEQGSTQDGDSRCHQGHGDGQIG